MCFNNIPVMYSQNLMFHVCPSGTNSLDITQCLLKKVINTVIILDFCKQLIFGPLRWFFLHSMLWHLTSKSHWKSKDSLSVKMQLGSVDCSGSSEHSLQKKLLCSFCPFIRLCRTNFAHNFLLPNILPQNILCRSGANEHSLLNWIYLTSTLRSPAVHTQ